MASGWRDAANGFVPRKPFARSQGRVVRVVGLGLCPEDTGSLKNIHSFKDICQVCCGLSLGLLVLGAPLDGGAFREWLRAAGKESFGLL